MRPTIDLPDALLKRVKTKMHEEDLTLRALVITGLEHVLHEETRLFQLRDASAGPMRGRKVSVEEINRSMDGLREPRFES